jgi:hypothetical protein
MVNKTLPPFDPPSKGELRALWRQYEGHPDVRRLILEVERLRRQMSELERLRLAALAAWAAEVGDSHQVALYKMRLLLQAEIERG